jgi:hypothetical protein
MEKTISFGGQDVIVKELSLQFALRPSLIKNADIIKSIKIENPDLKIIDSVEILFGGIELVFKGGEIEDIKLPDCGLHLYLAPYNDPELKINLNSMWFTENIKYSDTKFEDLIHYRETDQKVFVKDSYTGDIVESPVYQKITTLKKAKIYPVFKCPKIDVQYKEEEADLKSKYIQTAVRFPYNHKGVDKYIKYSTGCVGIV